jgi:hypothetical protein
MFSRHTKELSLSTMLVCGEEGNIESHIPRKGILYSLNHEEYALNFLELPVHHSNIHISLFVQHNNLKTDTIYLQTEVLRNLDTTLPLMSNDLPNIPQDISHKKIQYMGP